MTSDSGRLPQGGDAKQAPCAASQSGPEGIAQTPGPNNPPTSLDGLLKLAERCEQATGPVRELDALIFKALGAPVPFQFANKLVALNFDEAEQCYFAPIGDMRVRYEPPVYTASLDAAMSLVPEGWDWTAQTSFRKSKARANCDLTQEAPFAPEDWKVTSARAATPALALCAAALKARASQ
jgi:hypothetical protein